MAGSAQAGRRPRSRHQAKPLRIRDRGIRIAQSENREIGRPDLAGDVRRDRVAAQQPSALQPTALQIPLELLLGSGRDVLGGDGLAAGDRILAVGAT
jgi:hypothetical protein